MTKMVNALPNIISATVLMVVVVYLGRIVGNFFGNLLSSIGLDAMIGRLGIAKFGEAAGATKVSALIAWVVTAGIVLMGAMEAANLLGFGMLNSLLAQFSVFAGQLIMGVVIFGIGLFLANLAADAIKGSGSAQAGLLSSVARGAVLVFTGSMPCARWAWRRRSSPSPSACCSAPWPWPSPWPSAWVVARAPASWSLT